MIWKGLVVCSGSESPVVVVLSGSMEPAFFRGDILFLWLGSNNDDLRFTVGEIIVFKVKGRDIPIVHRIIEVHENESGEQEILTKGDNNTVDDRGLYNPGQMWLKKDEILGRARAYDSHAHTCMRSVIDRAAYCCSAAVLCCDCVSFLPYVGMVTIQLTDYPMIKYVLVGIMGIFVLTAKE